ncbi:hypothetical protein FHS27_000589 [Rhodopirellula rubra]|uniref:Uncharacterized protein n=1 Tax=Aporhodopirellula rubra TaxID=980271 RepID=A0A7W5DV98_9BACT|nr:hypothetical protein [Aporhodopirellula rubra]
MPWVIRCFSVPLSLVNYLHFGPLVDEFLSARAERFDFEGGLARKHLLLPRLALIRVLQVRPF